MRNILLNIKYYGNRHIIFYFNLR